MTKSSGGNQITRRGFLGGAAALGASALVPGLVGEAAAAEKKVTKVNSTINGVRLGINAPYSFHGQYTTAEETLDVLVKLGLSWVELRGPAIEGYAGIPAAPRRERIQNPTDAQRAAQRAAQQEYADEVRRWRLSQSMDKYRELRRMYEDAGVTVSLVKFPELSADMSDDEAEYVFQLAKAMGAYGITLEPPVSTTDVLGARAWKHQVPLGYHGHTAVDDPEHFARAGAWEQAFFYSPFNFANPDLGHWTASHNDSSLIPFIKKYSNRITNVHLKDRKRNMGPNVPWGQGDTPVAEVLRLMRDNKYEFQATIEFEYDVPQGSTLIAELAKCVQFAKDALNA